MSEHSKDLSEMQGFITPEMFATLIDNAPKCQAGISQIHGYGLIAVNDISEGEKIIDFSDPEVYVEKKFSELEPWRLKGGKYTGLTEETCLVSERFTKYSLLNHSRKPNAKLTLEERCIVAIRKIRSGEEVTVDYRLEPVSPEAKTYIQNFL